MTTRHRLLARLLMFALFLLPLASFPAPAFAGNNISVQVICKPGVGVAGADVKLYRVEANGDTHVVSDSRTDKKGMVQIRNFESGTYELRVVCSGGEVFTYKFFTGGAVDFSHAYLFRCCPPPPGAPPTGNDGLIAIDGKEVTGDVTAGSRATSKAEVVVGNGLRTVQFDTINGTVVVNLPDDMAAGDTISGTVVSKPKRGTPQEVAEHQAKMSLYNVKLRTAKTLSGPSDLDVTIPLSEAITPFTLNIPKTTSVAGTSPTNIFPWVVAGDPGRVSVAWYGTSDGVPVDPAPGTWHVYTTNEFKLQSMGQQGRSVEWFGPLGTERPILMYGPEGSSVQDFEKNTENVSGGFGLINVLAGSPRKCVFEAPTTFTGPVELFLKAGKVETTAPYRNVGIKLTAPTTTLPKGGSTVVTGEVTGVGGSQQPIPIHVECVGQVDMQGGNSQTLQAPPSSDPNAKFVFNLPITATKGPGPFTVTATVVVFDVCLQDDSNPQTVILLNSFTGNYIFTPSGGTSLSGQGTVTRKGCTITLTDSPPDRRVQGNIDPCTKTGSASVQLVSPKVKFTITDRNTTDNTCACGGCSTTPQQATNPPPTKPSDQPGAAPSGQPSPTTTPQPTPQPGTTPSNPKGQGPGAMTDDECVELADEVARLKDEIKKKEDELAGIPAEKAKTAKAIEDCKKELEAAKKAAKKPTDDLARQTQRKKNIENSIGPGKQFPDKDAAKKNFGDYEKDYDDAKKAKDDADKKVADAQKKCDDLKKKLDDLAKKEKSLPGEIEDLKGKLKEKEKELSDWKAAEEKKKQESGGTQPGGTKPGTQPGGTKPGGTQPGAGNPTAPEPPEPPDLPDWLRPWWEAIKHAVPGSEFADALPGGKETLGLMLARLNKLIVDEQLKADSGKPNNLKFYEQLKDRLQNIYNRMK